MATFGENGDGPDKSMIFLLGILRVIVFDIEVGATNLSTCNKISMCIPVLDNI